MSLFAQIFIIAMCIAVGIVLFLGLRNMMKGGSPSVSQNLMRWRVILQFLAIVVVMVALAATGGGA